MDSYNRQFLRDRWAERAMGERGERSPEETRREQDIMTYLDVKKSAEAAGSLLTEILHNVERRAVRYRVAINSSEQNRIATQKGGDVKAFEGSDRNRQLAHNALIDEVNLLSRQFREAGLGNEWRRTIGLERDDIARWGGAVSQLIYRKFEDEAA